MPPRQSRTQAEVAVELGLSQRQITNLIRDGLPTVVRRGRKVCRWPESLRWYVQHQIQAAAKRRAPTTRKGADDRRAEAEACLKELELAQKEGQLVTVAYHEERVAAILTRLRSALMAVPGKWSPRLLGCQSAPEALARLRTAIREVMTTMSQADEDDADEETADA